MVISCMSAVRTAVTAVSDVLVTDRPGRPVFGQGAHDGLQLVEGGVVASARSRRRSSAHKLYR